MGGLDEISEAGIGAAEGDDQSLPESVLHDQDHPLRPDGGHRTAGDAVIRPVGLDGHMSVEGRSLEDDVLVAGVGPEGIGQLVGQRRDWSSVIACEI